MDQEEWRSIAGFPNYEISSYGRVYSCSRRRFLNPVTSSGYAYVTLYNLRDHACRGVHCLVAEAFLDLNLRAREVNHLDGNKLNNFIDNLEWASSSENKFHAYRTGLRIPPRRQAIRIIETGEEFESIQACARAINGYPTNILRSIRRNQRPYRGLTFEYV